MLKKLFSTSSLILIQSFDVAAVLHVRMSMSNSISSLAIISHLKEGDF